jgi:hypothetical protein
MGHLAALTTLAAMAALPHAGSMLSLSLVALAWGIGTGTNWVLSSVAVQSEASDAMIGRMTALDELLSTTTMVMSALAGGRLLSAGVSPAVVVSAFAALGALAWAGRGLVVVSWWHPLYGWTRRS